MDFNRLDRLAEGAWRISPFGAMRVPAVIYAEEDLVADMDEKVYEQVTNVACLPGIVQAAYAMPDAHWGYGFPIGGVAAFDAGAGGVISAGGVGFDISCGVRTLHTGLNKDDIISVREELADALFAKIPAGMGRKGKISLDDEAMSAALEGGARWAVEAGFGRAEDLPRIEDDGCVSGAAPAHVSALAYKRQRRSMGTLGSGNHYLEVQIVTDIYDTDVADAFGLAPDDALLTIHCGSRGMGHQIASEFLKEMAVAAPDFGIELPDRDLACAPITSELGQRYIGAMRAAINCALANRQIIAHLAREVFAAVLPQADLKMLYDVSHNICKEETHAVNGEDRSLFVHRKGATRAFGPGHPLLPKDLRPVGQPVLIGGTMGTASYILVGRLESEQLAFSSACHGAGRRMSRRQAKKLWNVKELREELERRGIALRSLTKKGVVEEAPGAYKDVDDVARSTEVTGLAGRVARVRPVICIKG